MLELAVLREKRQEYEQRLALRNLNAAAVIDQLLQLDETRRTVQKELDDELAAQNKASKEIGDLYKSGKAQEANALKAEVASRKQQVDILQQRLREAEDALHAVLVTVPNAPNSIVPAGRSANDNVEVRRGGTVPELPAQALPHWELCERYGLMSLEDGVKLTGAGFPVYRGRGARLQRGLIQFFLDRATHAGYEEVIPPLLVNEHSGFGTGQLPDKEGQMYHVTGDDLYLIPTAEVPITNLFRDEILEESALPLRLCGYTPCFRREAGSYGKDVRGLNRLHQFDKVEIVEIAHPDSSYQRLEAMIAHVESLLQDLELPYRILRLCGGDMGFTSALTYDFEVYSTAQKRWLEVSSVSNFETYQANRLKCRFKPAGEKKTVLVHTLNGSALALPRIVAALLENNQTPDGIELPHAIHPYTGFTRIQ